MSCERYKPPGIPKGRLSSLSLLIRTAAFRGAELSVNHLHFGGLRESTSEAYVNLHRRPHNLASLDALRA
jgi:hypothetical protein